MNFQVGLDSAALVVIGILVRSTARYDGVQQQRPWLVHGCVTVLVCQFLLIVLRMRLKTEVPWRCFCGDSMNFHLELIWCNFHLVFYCMIQQILSLSKNFNFEVMIVVTNLQSFVTSSRMLTQEDRCRQCHSLVQHIPACILLASAARVLHFTLTKIFERKKVCHNRLK